MRARTYRKVDLRADIAMLCVVDCSTPPPSTEGCKWMNGDTFTNIAGARWEYHAVLQDWRIYLRVT